MNFHFEFCTKSEIVITDIRTQDNQLRVENFECVDAVQRCAVDRVHNETDKWNTSHGSRRTLYRLVTKKNYKISLKSATAHFIIEKRQVYEKEN